MRKTIIVCGILVSVIAGFGQNTIPSTQTNKLSSNDPVVIVTKYLNIIFVENKNGEGLSDILAKDFVFDDPFNVARSADEFISKTQGWIKTKKTLKMEKQFVDKNSVYSIYTIEVQTPKGDMESFQLNDYVDVKDGKIAKERVYVFDPLKFAKAMGFLDKYVKAYQ